MISYITRRSSSDSHVRACPHAGCCYEMLQKAQDLFAASTEKTFCFSEET